MITPQQLGERRLSHPQHGESSSGNPNLIALLIMGALYTLGTILLSRRGLVRSEATEKKSWLSSKDSPFGRWNGCFHHPAFGVIYLISGGTNQDRDPRLTLAVASLSSSAFADFD